VLHSKLHNKSKVSTIYLRPVVQQVKVVAFALYGRGSVTYCSVTFQPQIRHRRISVLSNQIRDGLIRWPVEPVRV